MKMTEEELKKEIKEKLKNIYMHYTQPSNFNPGVYFDASFEIIEEAIREAISKEAEDEIIFELRDALAYNTLFKIFIKEAIIEEESDGNSSLTQTKIEDAINEKFSNENNQ